MSTSLVSIPCTALALALALALAPSDAWSQTLYKLIDKNGKVTYSEKPPKDFDGKVIRLDIDPNANTMTLPKPPPVPVAPAGSSDASPKALSKAPSRADQLAVAQDRLDSARRALADARDSPKAGDVEWIGKVGGGARPMPSESYAKRLEELDANVKEAEANVRKLEQGS